MIKRILAFSLCCAVAISASAAALAGAVDKGDVNQDGRINARDVVVLRKYIVGDDVSISYSNADLNGDGNFNSRDVVALRRKIVGGYEELKTCGDNAFWSLSSDGVLRIYGNGEMYDWGGMSLSPWYNDRGSVKKVIIEEGITNIGTQAFYMCGATEYSIPKSITNIGEMAFATGCAKNIVLPEGIKVIEYGTFLSSELESIVIPDGVTKICDMAFAYGWNLEKVTIPASVTEIADDAFEMCDFLTISTTQGSYAYNYAIEKGIPVRIVE